MLLSQSCCLGLLMLVVMALSSTLALATGRTGRPEFGVQPGSSIQKKKNNNNNNYRRWQYRNAQNIHRGGSESVPAKSLQATQESDASVPLAARNNNDKDDPSLHRGPLKVLFLSADTGGGHRASAESLASQFLLNFPGSTYDLLDIWTTDGVLPYRSLVSSYVHLSAHPRQWRFLYHLSNSRPWELAMDWHSTLMCERRIRKRIAGYDPDVVVSVHPAMNNTPLHSLRHLAESSGRHIPFFTVVTDLGSGHCTWFQKRVDKLYVASERLRKLAKRRGRTPDAKLVMTGLPIRADFATQSEKLGKDRMAPAGRAYQTQVKAELGLDETKPMVLVMGGGEGVGSLATIVDELYTSLAKRGLDVTICVVCGRNAKLQNALNSKTYELTPQRMRKRSRWFGRNKAVRKAIRERGTPERLGQVKVVGLGFVTNMADYMVAADVLVTKAGPGSIAEAAAVGLPVLLTSFLPGQEAGNVDFVLENGFGEYAEDPVLIAEEVSTWLEDPVRLAELSHRARAVGRPNAASEIVVDIGSETHVWKALQEAQ